MEKQTNKVVIYCREERDEDGTTTLTDIIGEPTKDQAINIINKLLIYTEIRAVM